VCAVKSLILSEIAHIGTYIISKSLYERTLPLGGRHKFASLRSTMCALARLLESVVVKSQFLLYEGERDTVASGCVNLVV